MSYDQIKFDVHAFAGVYIFHFAPPPPPQKKLRVIGWLGKKYLLRKQREFKGEVVEKRGKRKKYHFGKNIIFWRNIHPCVRGRKSNEIHQGETIGKTKVYQGKENQRCER